LCSDEAELRVMQDKATVASQRSATAAAGAAEKDKTAALCMDGLAKIEVEQRKFASAVAILKMRRAATAAEAKERENIDRIKALKDLYRSTKRMCNELKKKLNAEESKKFLSEYDEKKFEAQAIMDPNAAGMSAKAIMDRIHQMMKGRDVQNQGRIAAAAAKTVAQREREESQMFHVGVDYPNLTAGLVL